MLSEISKNAINNLVYQVMYLAHLGCPLVDDGGFPYYDLVEFIDSLDDDATDEEKGLIKSVIREELENGSYLGNHVEKAGLFLENTMKFFDDNEEIDLNSFWFGKTLLGEVVDLVGEHILEEYNEAFKKLSEH